MTEGNFIGAPSVTMVKHDRFIPFVPHFQWKLDLSSYLMMAVNGCSFHFINEPLVEIHIHSKQLSNEVGHNVDIDFNETVYLLQMLLATEKYRMFSRDRLVDYLNVAHPTIPLSAVISAASPLGIRKVGVSLNFVIRKLKETLRKSIRGHRKWG